ncbi:MAG: hypothetical protein HOW73_20635 [Polyangiaceae bacterium]|nr:hypothetical protein [Polyangiaceae bacterium]
MLFSRFAPLGLYSFTRKAPIAKQIHSSLVNSLGGQYELGEGSHIGALLFAIAMSKARVATVLRRAQAQRYARDVDHLIPVLEDQYDITPSADWTIADRQAEIARRKARRVNAWTRQAIAAALGDALGDDFVAYRPLEQSEAAIWPTNCGDSPMVLTSPKTPRKAISLKTAISTGLGAPQTVGVELLSAPSNPTSTVATSPQPGDVFVFDASNSAIAEKVTIASYTAIGLNKTITATFNKPHDAGTVGYTNSFPWWTSTKRHALVVLTAEAAQDANKRRRVDGIMRRAARGVSTWDIVASSDGITTVRFRLDTAARGLGFTTLEAVTI